MFRSISMYLGVLFISVAFSSQIIAAPNSGGYALFFNPGQYVTIPNSGSLNPTQMTLECWVKFTTPFENTVQFVSKGYWTTGSYSLIASYRYSKLTISFQMEPYGNIWGVDSSGYNLESYQWYHIAGTYDGDWMRLYINEKLVSQRLVGSFVLSSDIPLKFGDIPIFLDEVRIWSVARTQEEIQSTMYREIYNSPGLVSAWHFNEGAGQILHDSVDANNGYLGSSPDVDANDPQWVQSTAPVSGFLVISPNGGEEWQTDSTHTINWFTYKTTSINIDYSSDAGTTWKPIAYSVDASLGSYSWKLPTEPTSQGLIRITDSSNPERFDVSDSLFTISNAYIHIVSPNGGEKWETNTVQNILINSLGVDVIYIDYSLNNGTNWIPYVNAVRAAADTFSWRVPFTPTVQAKVRIKNSDSTLVAVSENPFSIVKSSIILNSPKGGDLLEPGVVEDITWTATPGVDSVRVEYSPDNGTTWQFLTNRKATDLYHWSVPSIETNKGIIKVSWISHSEVYATNSGTFSIRVQNPLPWTFYPSSSPVKLLEVNGDAVWYVTDTNVLRLNRKTAVIDTIITPFNSALNEVNILKFDSTGRPWFGNGGSNSNFLLNFDGVSWIYYRLQGDLTGLGIDSNDVKYITTNSQGIYSFQSFDGVNWKTIVSDGVYHDYFSFFTDVLLVDNHRHSVWVGNQMGPEEIFINTNQTGINGITFSEMWSIWPQQGILDSFGNFWFCSNKGYISTYTSEKWIHYSSNNSPIPWKADVDANHGIAVTPDNVKWFGGPGGLVRYDGANWKTIPVSADSLKNSIWSLKVDSDGNIWGITPDGIARYGYIPGPSSVNEKFEEPVAFLTITNFPNPFNPSTTIEFTLPSSGKANLVIYDIMGHKVRELISGQVSAGIRSVLWDGRDGSGRSVSSGVYFARLTVGKSFAVKKMLMMK
jgi:hypothetical protein